MSHICPVAAEVSNLCCTKQQKVIIFGKYHKYTLVTLQTNPRHSEEEPQNIYSYKTLGRQLKQSKQLSDDCKTRKDTKYCTTKHRPTQNPHKQCLLEQNIAYGQVL